MKSAAALLLALSLGPVVSAAQPSGKDHWAFRPPARPSPPKVGNPRWVRTPPDAFILARLEKEKLTPSAEADRATLLRRLSFDLLGLPPSPKEVADFLADASPDAYERLVERLLASPRYGERWGRHWLDVAGYADSNGYFSADSDRPLAWKYRDYVVRSFNTDAPFDRFAREQLAGDELAGYTSEGDITPDMVEQLTATHLLRNAPDGTGESDGNAAELRADRYAVIEGNVQIIGSAFLGLTVQCARCHDHKFEPIAQEEYYGLQAILKPVYDHDRWLKPNERNIALGTHAERQENKRRIEKFERELKAVKDSLEGLTAPYRRLAQQEALEKLPDPLRAMVKKALDTAEKERTEPMKSLLKTNEAVAQIKDESLVQRFPELQSASAALKDAVKKKEAERPQPLPQLAVATDVTPEPPPHHVLVRGNYGSPGRTVAFGFRFRADEREPKRPCSSSHSRCCGWAQRRCEIFRPPTCLRRLGGFHRKSRFCPSGGQSHLAASFWGWPGRHDGQFWPDRGAADASRVARLAGHRVCAIGIPGKSDPSPHCELSDLPPGQPAAGRGLQARRR